jgi:hypothetical protein
VVVDHQDAYRPGGMGGEIMIGRSDIGAVGAGSQLDEPGFGPEFPIGVLARKSHDYSIPPEQEDCEWFNRVIFMANGTIARQSAM